MAGIVTVLARSQLAARRGPHEPGLEPEPSIVHDSSLEPTGLATVSWYFLSTVSANAKEAWTGSRSRASLGSVILNPGLSLVRIMRSCQAPVSQKGLSMRRCAIGMVFLVFCHFWTALAQTSPPAGADPGQRTRPHGRQGGSISDRLRARLARGRARGRGQGPERADARERPKVAQDP